jgi:hypothetical protein
VIGQRVDRQLSPVSSTGEEGNEMKGRQMWWSGGLALALVGWSVACTGATTTDEETRVAEFEDEVADSQALAEAAASATSVAETATAAAEVATFEAQARETAAAREVETLEAQAATTEAEAATARSEATTAAAGTATVEAQATALQATVEAQATAIAATATTEAFLQEVDLLLEEMAGDGHDCLAGPSQPASAPAHVDVRQAQFTSDAVNASISLAFDVPGGDLEAAVQQSGLLWSVQVGIQNPANALPAADPAVYAGDFVNEAYGFNYFAAATFPTQRFQFRNGQWTTEDDPAGVAATLGGFTFTMAISATQLPAQGKIYLVVSSDNTICDRVGVTDAGPAIEFRQEESAAPGGRRSFRWYVATNIVLPDATPAVTPGLP